MNTLGCLIIDLQGTALTQEEAEMLKHPLVGGVIFFTRNYESRQQITSLCQQVRSVREIPLLLMVDQEGGRVQRFLQDFSRLPSMGVFGKLYDSNPQQACDQARDCGWLMATELLTVGIDFSLAPVLDLNKSLNQVIGERAFHRDPQIVTTLARSFIQGMREAGMAATGKHFPGHGSVTVDSHIGLPIDDRSFQAITQDDLLPFTALLKTDLQAIMAAHIVFPQQDDVPVTFSHFWLQEVLRQQLQFKGVIFSDDLHMEGANISSVYADRVAAARQAGCDFTLVCNHREGVINVLDHFPLNQGKVSYEKWSVLQGRFSSTAFAYVDQPRWQQARQFLQEIV